MAEGEARMAADCGAVPVPRDWANREGPTMPLRVVVLPATGTSRPAAPLFYLAGWNGEVARIRRLAGGGEQGFELQVGEPQGGWRMLAAGWNFTLRSRAIMGYQGGER